MRRGPSPFVRVASCTATAIAVCLLLQANSALAAPEPARLVWVRGEHAETCSDGPTIAAAVSARLGETVFSDAAKRSIEGFIEHGGGRWTARIFVRDASGHLVGSRELSSDAIECAPIESAVTLAIALAIDPDAALRSLAPSSASPTALAPAPPTATPPLPASCPPCPAPVCPAPAPCPAARPCPIARPCPEPEASRAGKTATLTLRAILAGGLLPTASVGAEVAGELSISGALHATVGTLFLPEVRPAGSDFSWGLTAAWAGACVDGWSGRWGAASLCATAMLGAIHAVVYVLEPSIPGQQLWAGAALTPRIRVRLVGPVVWEAGGELIVPVTRQQFTVGGQSGVAFQEGPVAGAGYLGLGWSIP